ncbi:MAG: proline racemase family protein [Bacillota bacterium]
MRVKRVVFAVDSHTMGEPTRIVVGGIPHIPGKTMAEKKKYLEKEIDALRTALMLEPRGHRDMFGSILTAPVAEEADLGIVFMDSSGYLNMCGHGTIGAVTVALETGILPANEPETRVVLDTPAGLVRAVARVSGERVASVTVENVPAFMYRKDIKVVLPDQGEITLDISYGGNFFAIVPVEQFGLDIIPENGQILSSLGMKILQAVREQVSVVHPEHPHINSVDLVEFSGKPLGSMGHARNAVVFGKAQLDRSPCGTGTCAKMASLFAKGQLSLGQEFIHESIIGTTFAGRLLQETKVGDYPAVIPQITGRAFITAIQQFIIDPEDPLRDGFFLG